MMVSVHFRPTNKISEKVGESPNYTITHFLRAFLVEQSVRLRLIMIDIRLWAHPQFLHRSKKNVSNQTCKWHVIYIFSDFHGTNSRSADISWKFVSLIHKYCVADTFKQMTQFYCCWRSKNKSYNNLRGVDSICLLSFSLWDFEYKSNIPI